MAQAKLPTNAIRLEKSELEYDGCGKFTPLEIVGIVCGSVIGAGILAGCGYGLYKWLARPIPMETIPFKAVYSFDASQESSVIQYLQTENIAMEAIEIRRIGRTCTLFTTDCYPNIGNMLRTAGFF